jgi:polyphosphate kinase
LVAAPGKLHRKIVSLIEAETKAAQAGQKARIFAKVNALVDESVVEHLCRASSAGVQIDLLVRGACSLVPGIKNISENIRVVSIVDRYLEHSRIYFFESSSVMYLSSADWMPRNFFSRLEVAFPVLDPRIFTYLKETVIPTYLADTVKGRELKPDGLWHSRQKREGGIRSQFQFQELASQDFRGTAL